MKKLLVALLLVFALLLPSACGKTGENSSAPESGGVSSVQSVEISEETGEEESAASEISEISEEESEPSEETSEEESIYFDPETLFDVTAPEGTFDIHSADQSEYVFSGSLESIQTLADGWHECSKPRAYAVDFAVLRDNAPFELGRFDGVSALLDTDPAFSNPKTITTYEKTANGFRVEFGNLLLDAKYYYKLRAKYGADTYESAVYEFYTSAYAPRNLNVEGVSNVRDLGGWFIDDSHRVKQGLIFRGAAYEDLQYGTHITQRGINQALGDLGVKTEIELRWISVGEIESRTGSLLGEGVNYYEYEFNYDTPQLLVGNKQSIANCFARFADETQYPIYYHCRIGTDRTGVLSYLLLGMLGVPKEQLLTDYLFSNFGYVGGNRSVSTVQSAYIDVLDSYGGATLQQKITNYLINECGVTEEQIEKIKEIMIEELY
ncbi:MAG: tyrosine-protein phosphatase [Clostridia bacterium]|nr:tyrosine-protein phosphatase [Clostridia bacterium]